MQIRGESLEDIEAIHRVNVAAFERESEANLVKQLRGVASTFSFVAIDLGQIVGHIFYSPVDIDGKSPDRLLILGLAPIAVLPTHQRQGIGSLLIRHSLQELTRLGVQAVVVLGHPQYYPRFGFIPAKDKGLRCEYTVPDEAFIVLELKPGALDGCAGIVKYRSEFNNLE